MQVALTNVSGDPREILLRQQSSARYFQRPDRGDGSGGFLSNRLDSQATSLRGAGAIHASREGDRRLVRRAVVQHAHARLRVKRLRLSAARRLHLYNANIGRMDEADELVPLAHGARRADRPRPTTRATAPGSNFTYFVQETTPQFWNSRCSISHRGTAIDDRLLRGGPAVETPTQSLPQRRTSRPTRATRGSGTPASVLLGRARRRESVGIVERRLSPGAESHAVVRTVVEPVARNSAVRGIGHRQHGDSRSTERGTSCPISTSARSASTRASA